MLPLARYVSEKLQARPGEFADLELLQKRASGEAIYLIANLVTCQVRAGVALHWVARAADLATDLLVTNTALRFNAPCQILYNIPEASIHLITK